MNDQTEHLQQLIDRFNRGEAKARDQLIERAYSRLRRLAAFMLNSFPRVQAQHEVDSVLNDSWPRLRQALDKTHPPTVADFFRLAAHKIRQVLLDMAERQKRWNHQPLPAVDSSQEQRNVQEPGNQTHDPARLALWTELHRRVEQLPEDEKQVFELHYYTGMTQAEIARLLQLHPRKVSYLWVAATEKLADCLPVE